MEKRRQRQSGLFIPVIEATILQAAISGIVGGLITGVAAWAAMRVEIKYLRRDVDHAHQRLDGCHLIEKR